MSFTGCDVEDNRRESTGPLDGNEPTAQTAGSESSGPLGQRDADGVFLIDGDPLHGVFHSGDLSYESLELALDHGVNLFMSYNGEVMEALLDENSPLGNLLHERGARVMPHVLGQVSNLRLVEPVDADSSDLRVNLESRDWEDIYWIGEEAVKARGVDDQGYLVDAIRGWDDTQPTPHPEGRFVVMEDRLRTWMARRKDSPNLWGVWIMDDFEGDQKDAMRNAYRILKEADRDEAGNPLGHVIVAGFNHPAAVIRNFAAGTADAVGLYIYPTFHGKYRHMNISEWLSQMLPVIEERDPGRPFIGAFQGFVGAGLYTPKPTALQMRQQAMDFAAYGARGLMAYAWSMSRPVERGKALAELEDLREEFTAIKESVTTGGIDLGVRTASIQREATYPRERELDRVLFDASAVSPGDVPGRAATVRKERKNGEPMLVVKWDRMSEDRPGSGGPHIRLGNFLGGATDWTNWGYLVLDLDYRSPRDKPTQIRIRVDSEDGDSAQADRILPAAGPHRILVRIEDLADRIDISRISEVFVMGRFPLWKESIGIKRIGLARPIFKPIPDSAVTVAETRSPLVVDGVLDEEVWQNAPSHLLRYRNLRSNPIRKSTIQAARRGNVLYLGIKNQRHEGDPALKVTEDDSSKQQAWRFRDDTVRVILWNEKTNNHMVIWANSEDAVQGKAFKDGRYLRDMKNLRVGSIVMEEAWTLEMELPLEFPVSEERPTSDDWHVGVLRRHQQIGPLSFPGEDPNRLYYHVAPVGRQP